jgi:polysaccharide biosynthesis transport protein
MTDAVPIRDGMGISTSGDMRPLIPGTGDSGGEQPLLMRYLTIARRRMWWIIGAVVAAFVIGLVLTLLTTPLYTATTTIEISRDAQRVVDIKGVEGGSNVGDLEFYQTQYGLLKSRALAEKVASDLRLDQNPQFFDMFGIKQGGGGLFNKAVPRAANATADRSSQIRIAADLLLANVAIAPVRLSRLVEVTFTSPDPGMSARIANAWTAHFIAANLERRYDATSYARKFLEDRLEQLRAKLEESEKALVAYASDQQIISIPSAGASRDAPATERSLVADNLATLNAELTVATADMIKARSRVSGRGAGSELLSNTTIGALRQRRAEISADYQKLLIQFEPQYPAARALASQLAQIDGALAREEGRVRDSVSNDYRSAEQRVAALSAQVESLKSGFIDQRRRSIQYNIYQREADTNRQLYDGLLQRYKEIGVAGGVGTNNISVVDQADIPAGPSKPRVFVNLIISILAGLGIGIAIAFALEQIDETISNPADVQRVLHLPLLGAIPKSKSDTPITELADRKSSLVEAYLSVQANLEFATSHGAPKTLTVTSTRPAEGKSTTAYAIAHALARSGKKVLLVDGDMRSPSVHRLMSFTNEGGLSNYLAGSDDLTPLIRRTELAGLAIMTAGPQPPNAAELLNSGRMKNLLVTLLKTFDHVVIDSPPVMGLADAPLIAGQVEAVAFVVESHGIKSSLVSVAVARLRSANANIVGAVLTKFDDKRAFGYHYDYGYGYGEQPNAKA